MLVASMQDDVKAFYVIAVELNDQIWFCGIYGETLQSHPKGKNVVRYKTKSDALDHIDMCPHGSYIAKVLERRSYDIHAEPEETK